MPDAGTVVTHLARARVPLGFVCGAAALFLAMPTRRSLVWGGAVAVVGEALRIWAAGHLVKSREVTTSGPYRWVAHPLYVGSSIMALGIGVASRRLAVVGIVAVYLVVTIGAAVRREEAFLRERFGDRYESYRQGRDIEPRRFSVERVVTNREHRAIAGWLVAALLLWWKAAYDRAF